MSNYLMSATPTGQTRHRINWRGKAILQVQEYIIYSAGFPSHDIHSMYAWRDADRADLKRIKKVEKSARSLMNAGRRVVIDPKKPPYGKSPVPDDIHTSNFETDKALMAGVVFGHSAVHVFGDGRVERIDPLKMHIGVDLAKEGEDKTVSIHSSEFKGLYSENEWDGAVSLEKVTMVFSKKGYSHTGHALKMPEERRWRFYQIIDGQEHNYAPFVGRAFNRVQDIQECLIADGWEVKICP